MSTSPLAAALAAVALLGGTSAALAAEPAAKVLAGTRWQLVGIDTMAAGQTPAKPADPSQYTLEFGADGNAALRLDCNRATTPWKAVPAHNGTSGTLQFGAVATSRAACGPASLEPRLAKGLAQVRSFMIKSGRLYLTLQPEGAMYTWAALP